MQNCGVVTLRPPSLTMPPGPKVAVPAAEHFLPVDGALPTIEGYEAMHMLGKGQTRWVKKGDIIAQVLFVNRLFGLAE